MSGALYIVSTPIGNMQDITYRAVEVLKTVDFIISEDTRETSKILNKFSINKPQVSYRDQNHHKIVQELLELLASGKQIALVSDNGTPAISDPGFKLIEAVHTAGHTVLSIPGPSALTAAISVAGLPTDKVVFLGFLPKKAQQRANILKEYGALDATLVIYESPFRAQKLFQEIYDELGNRFICICRELTKINETITRCPVKDILVSKVKVVYKGEFVVLVSKKDYMNE